MSESTGLKGFFRKHLGWVVTVFLTLLFWLQTCNLQQKIDQGKQQITQLSLDKQTLTTKVNEQGKTIYSQTAVITDNTKSLSQLTDTIFNLKAKDRKNTETIAYYKGVTNTSLSHITVPYLDTLAMHRFSDSVLAGCADIVQYMNDSTIQVPRVALVSTPDYRIGATVQKSGIIIDTLSIPDILQLRFVQHKGGLFRSSKVEVQYFHSNPYVKSLTSNSVFYKPKKASFFKRVIIPVVVGVGAGLLIKL